MPCGTHVNSQPSKEGNEEIIVMNRMYRTAIILLTGMMMATTASASADVNPRLLMLQGETELVLQELEKGMSPEDKTSNDINPETLALFHSADTNMDLRLNLSETLALVQWFNLEVELHCDGIGYSFSPGGTQECLPHSSDYLDQDWKLGLDELLRGVQLYNAQAYVKDVTGEDGFNPVPKGSIPEFTLLGSYAGSDQNTNSFVALLGVTDDGYAYEIRSGVWELTVFDVGNPAAPTRVGGLPWAVAYGANPVEGAFSADGNTLYIAMEGGAADPGGIAVVNITNRQTPQFVTLYKPSAFDIGSGMTRVSAIEVRGTSLYAVSYAKDAFAIFNVTNPASPAVVSSTSSPIYMDGPTDLAVDGNYAYVIGAAGLTLTAINIANPASPLLQPSHLYKEVEATDSYGTWQRADDHLVFPSEIKVYKNGPNTFVFITCGYVNSLVVFDVTTPATLAGGAPFAWVPTTVTAAGSSYPQLDNAGPPRPEFDMAGSLNIVGNTVYFVTGGSRNLIALNAPSLTVVDILNFEDLGLNDRPGMIVVTADEVVYSANSMVGPAQHLRAFELQ